MTTFGPASLPVGSTTSPHLTYLRKCLSLAEKSPPRPTNFRVGAILLSRRRSEEERAAVEAGRSQNDPHMDISDDRILSTGYTMELAGNTHAEQCCLANYAAVHSVPDERVAEVLPCEPDRMLVMYVTMEPCGRRLSGNEPCVQRIIKTRVGEDRRGVEKVYFGVKEPGTFVGESKGCQMLTAAGIRWEAVSGMEREILEVATAGHENQEIEIAAALGEETNLDNISEDERRRQEQLPRNPKKRMMESEVR